MKNAQAIPVLMYHHVSPVPGLVTITPDNFRAQMRYLATHGWHTISLDSLARFLSGEALPERSIVVTFDDGYLDNWVYAHPVMAEHGFHGVIFLVTGWVGDGPARPHAGTGDVPATLSHKSCMEAVRTGRTDAAMLRWSEVQTMHEAGTFEFHSHTHSHTRWDRMETDAARRDRGLTEDLERSRTALHGQFGDAGTHLCWPQGYYDDAYRAVARRAGFSHLYTVRRGACLPTTPREEIPRIVVKDKPAAWLGRRLEIYRRPWLSWLYAHVRPD